MNVKKGDLAYTVGLHFPENNGRIVRVIRLYTAGEILPGHTLSYELSDTTNWVVESVGSPLLVHFDGFVMIRAIADRCLRPIRPQPDDATDETLTWLDVPTKQGETA